MFWEVVAPASAVFCVTVTSMLGLRILARPARLTDKPGGRKRHIGEIPLVGGIAMFVGLLFGLWLLGPPSDATFYFIVSATLLVVVGVLDDRRGISWQARLLVQALGALIMITAGEMLIFDIGDPFGRGIIHTGRFGILFTLLVTMVVINAFNFIDGVDGLAASLAVIALIAGAVGGGLTGQTAGLAVMMCAAIFAFMLFNLPFGGQRLRSFMGDAGSTLLGLMVAWLTVVATQGDERLLSPVQGLWLAVVPLADFFTCFVRRLAKRRSPFRPGREHLHHLLLRAGLTERMVLGMLVAMGLFYASAGVAGALLGISDVVMFSLWAVILASQYWLLKRYATLLRFRRRRRLDGHREVAIRDTRRESAARSA